MSLLDAEVWSGSIFTGQWSTAAGGETAVVELATGEEIGRIGFAGPDDIARAAARAFEEQRDWARRSPRSARRFCAARGPCGRSTPQRSRAGTRGGVRADQSGD